jgi:UTP--glucose-1-phosphate uridylyltransferase
MKKITKCIIPAAGLGTRLLPATKSQPKEMVPVGRKPVIQHVVEEAVGAGVKQILIITGGKKRAIEDHFDRDRLLEQILKEKGNDGMLEDINFLEKYDVKIFYTRQSEPTGLADAVLLGDSFVDGEPFAVSLGDTIVQSYDGGSFLWKLMDSHVRTGAAATVAVEEVGQDRIGKFGIVKPRMVDGLAMRLDDLVEKPKPGEAPSNMAIAARYVFEPDIFDAINRTKKGHGGEKQLTDAMRILLQDGKPVWAYKLNSREKRHDIGDLRTYALAFVDMCLADPEVGPDLRKDLQKLISTRE